MSVVAIIPAKGSSVRIPRKNVRQFCGRPVISYTIETAKECGLFDRIIVSTEDAEVAWVAKTAGAEIWVRPEELTRDDYGPDDVAAHVLNDLGRQVEFACVLYATAPLMSKLDLLHGYEVVRDRQHFSFAISVNSDRTMPLQDAAQFIWGTRQAFQDERPLLFSERTALIPIAPERVCDINVLEDWPIAERMYEALQCA